MRLTLKPLRAPDDRLPAVRRVAEGELSIGRGAENDWVLPDTHRHLSKRHCTLSMRGGRWSVTDHSTNGTFVNRDIQPIGDGSTRNLRDGDKLRLGLYEIEVRITDEETIHGDSGLWRAQTGIDMPITDPFGDGPGTGMHFRDGADGPGGKDSTLPQETTLDPLLLGTRPEPDTDVLPNLPIIESKPQPEPPELGPPRWERSDRYPMETINIPGAKPHPVKTGGTADAGGAAPLAAFLDGAGMPDAKPADPEALMAGLGATFRALVVGLREVMITRARIKSEFRIEQTLMRSQGNNPLKFSADDEDALVAMLGIGRRSDVKPAEAVRGALHDIHSHETAAIAGMKAGLAAVLARVDPGRIVSLMAPKGELSTDAKAQAWDVFVRQHAEIAASAPDDLDGIFGRAFARGYEQAIQRLE